MAFFLAAASTPVRKLLRSAFASDDNRGRPDERAPARLWERRSGAVSRPGSAPNTKSDAVHLGCNDNWPCRTCRNVPREYREGTIDQSRAAQSGTGSCAQWPRVWRGSVGRSSLIHSTYTRIKKKSSGDSQCEFALQRTYAKTRMESDRLPS
jgi:hypothetical protein